MAASSQPSARPPADGSGRCCAGGTLSRARGRAGRPGTPGRWWMVQYLDNHEALGVPGHAGEFGHQLPEPRPAFRVNHPTWGRAEAQHLSPSGSPCAAPPPPSPSLSSDSRPQLLGGTRNFENLCKFALFILHLSLLPAGASLDWYCEREARPLGGSCNHAGPLGHMHSVLAPFHVPCRASTQHLPPTSKQPAQPHHAHLTMIM